MTLTEHLVKMAQIWSRVNSRSLPALGTIVANDGKFFARIERGSRPTVETFEKFLSFFRDGANWPEGRIPEMACDLLNNFVNIATGSSASPGTDSDSTEGRAALEDDHTENGLNGGPHCRQPGAVPGTPSVGTDSEAGADMAFGSSSASERPAPVEQDSENRSAA